MAFHKKGFPCGSAGKEFACNAGDLGLIPGLGRSLFLGEGKGYPLQYSGLENSMDCIVHGVAKSRTRLSDFHFHFHKKPFFSLTTSYVCGHTYASHMCLYLKQKFCEPILSLGQDIIFKILFCEFCVIMKWRNLPNTVNWYKLLMGNIS